MQIDITTLSDEQLAALSVIDPVAVGAEQSRRAAYQNITDFLTDLAQAGADLDNILSQIKGTQAANAVKDTKIVQIIQRGLGYARFNNLTFAEPELRPVVIVKHTRKAAENAAPVPPTEGAQDGANVAA